MTAAADARNGTGTRPFVIDETARVKAPSLRLRVGGWTVVVFTATLAAFTAIGIAAERRNLEEVAEADAQAFLAHVAQMPQFRSDHATAAAALAPLRESVRSAGGDLDLASAGASPEHGLVTAQPLELRDGNFELRLRSDPRRWREVASRSVLLHAFHGLLALGALLLGTEWILRRGLVAPLARMSHELELMTKGWGWRASVPAADREFADLSRAIAGLGPSLAAQAEQWVEAERRAAAGSALQQLRLRLRDPRCRAYALLGDLQARNLVVPEGVRKLRLLLAELQRIAAVIDEEEKDRCQPPAAAGNSDPARSAAT